MDAIANGWFTEISPLWPDQRFGIRVKRVIHTENSTYQNILIFDSESHGRVLVLDGIIQCTESDEFAYQEMIAFLPINCHRTPHNVLIVGGGDGGVAREVVKHDLVRTVHQVEIDELVVELSKKHLPFMAQGFASPKLQLHIGDGLEYMKKHENEFDVIITDSSDPIGPAVCLFTDEFFALLKSALKPNGIICSQAGNPFICTKQARDMLTSVKKSFSNVAYAYATVPTYPSGQIGFVLATDDTSIDFQEPHTVFTPAQLDQLALRYYDDKMHRSSFQLPRFIQKSFHT